MKVSQSNTWKLGLFVTVALMALGGAIWWLGLRRFDKETFPLVTFFDESVQGLDVGAPVDMRGVRIGNVSQISFAPDQLTVEVHMELYVSKLNELGLGELPKVDPDSGQFDFGTLRARVAMQGITGTCYLAVDKLPNVQLPKLDFPPPWNYLPSAPSTLQRLEKGAVGIVDSLPGIVENLDLVMSRLAEGVKDLDVKGISDSAKGLLNGLDEKVAQLDVPTLQTNLDETLTQLRSFLAEAEKAVEQFSGDTPPVERLITRFEDVAHKLEKELGASDIPGTTAELRTATAALSQLARDVNSLSGEAYLDLVAFRELMTALRSFTETLERNPSALIRGRAKD